MMMKKLAIVSGLAALAILTGCEEKKPAAKVEPAAAEKQVQAVKTTEVKATEEKNEMKWYTDFKEAETVAKSENKPMFVLFTGSDWCPWCVKLDEEILTKPEFEAFAAKNMVMVYVDFPRSKPLSDAQRAANRELAGKYDIKGYPTVLLLSADGKVLGRTGYKQGGPAPYIKELEGMIK